MFIYCIVFRMLIPERRIPSSYRPMCLLSIIALHTLISTSQWCKIYLDTSFNTIIMDTSHDPNDDDGHASTVNSDVDSTVHVFISCIMVYRIKYRMYLIFIINQNLILCDHENKN